MNKIVIFGNGSVAREVFYAIEDFQDYEVAGFTVDASVLDTSDLFGLKVVPFDSVEAHFSPDEYAMFIAVGYVKNNSIRKSRYQEARDRGYELINVVSPRAVVNQESLRGDNILIHHNCVISRDAYIGSNVILGAGCLIAHDVSLGDHCFLSEGVMIAGGTSVGRSCFLGLRAAVRNKARIEDDCVIGAGSVLLEDAESKSVYLGTGATKLKVTSDKLPGV